MAAEEEYPVSGNRLDVLLFEMNTCFYDEGTVFEEYGVKEYPYGVSIFGHSFHQLLEMIEAEIRALPIER